MPSGELTPAAKDYYSKYGYKEPSKGSSSSIGYTPPSVTKSPVVVKMCKHWQDPIKLAEGVTIHASAYRDHPDKDWYYPAIGLYFYSGWDDFSPKPDNTFSAGWAGPRIGGGREPGIDKNQLCFIDWPDFQAPRNTEDTLKLLEYVLNQAGAGKFVEIGCMGAHGRTGTALAAMLIMLGEVDAIKAVEWVREHHCEHAVEGQKQVDWLWEVAEKLYPNESTTLRLDYAAKALLEKNKATPKTTTSTWPLDDDADNEQWWILEACREIDHLVAGGTKETAAVRQVCFWYDLDEDAVFDAWAVDLHNKDGDDVTEEVEEALDEYDEWVLANEAVNRELGISDECGLCEQAIEVCACFINTPIQGIF